MRLECSLALREIQGDDFAIADPAIGLFLVADGLGGRPGGARASRIAAESFRESLLRAPRRRRLDDAVLQEAVAAANGAVRAIAGAEPALAGLGTTLSAVVIEGSRAKVVHVGDSRVHLAAGGRLERLTRDHTLAEALLEAGNLSAEAARSYPLRHLLARAVGTSREVVADIREISLEGTGFLLLATDGLARIMSEDRIREVLAAGPGEGAERTCGRIQEIVDAAPIQDDVTVVVVKFTAGVGPAGAGGESR